MCLGPMQSLMRLGPSGIANVSGTTGTAIVSGNTEHYCVRGTKLSDTGECACLDTIGTWTWVMHFDTDVTSINAHSAHWLTRTPPPQEIKQNIDY